MLRRLNKLNMAKITFKPQNVSKILLSILLKRERKVVSERFGLNSKGKFKTLEAIGQFYNITRERVRQIEANAVNKMRKSEEFKKTRPVFDELRDLLDFFGYVVPEEKILNYISKAPSVKSYVCFLLFLGENFSFDKESLEFRKNWSTNGEVKSQVKDALRRIYQKLDRNTLLTEDEIADFLIKEIKFQNKKWIDKDTLFRWIYLSKKLDKNPLGEWGVSDSPNVKIKGIRDYVYLVIRKNGSPMHFSETAKAIEKNFNKKAYIATCHNELIKDKRFILVGRGLYALSEWGYSRGIVRDVIRNIIDKYGALTRDEILEKVRKERYVKDNTILVNLHDSKNFKRDTKGRYMSNH